MILTQIYRILNHKLYVAINLNGMLNTKEIDKSYKYHEFLNIFIKTQSGHFLSGHLW